MAMERDFNPSAESGNTAGSDAAPSDRTRDDRPRQGDQCSADAGEDEGSAPKEGADDHLKDDQKPTQK